MPDEEKKVDIDTSGPEVDVDIEAPKEEQVVETEQPKQETDTTLIKIKLLKTNEKQS